MKPEGWRKRGCTRSGSLEGDETSGGCEMGDVKPFGAIWEGGNDGLTVLL